MSGDPLSALDAAVRAVCPIDGMALLDPVLHTVRIDFQASATPAQQTAANGVVATWDWSNAAQAVRDAQTANATATAYLDNGLLASGDALSRIVVALALTILDEFNVVLPLLTTPKPPVTQAQLIAAVKAKIATLPT